MRLKKRHIIATLATAVAIAGGGYVATHQAPPTTSAHIVDAAAYPNPELTPGLAATLNPADLTATYTDSCPSGKISCTYSQDHRNVPTSEHDQVYNEYSVPPDQRNFASGEVDHFYPLCAGGSNDIKNLWYMPRHIVLGGIDYGYKTKDLLEAYICVEIKAGRMDPNTAYQKMTGDWVAFYNEVKGNLGAVPAFGSMDNQPVE